MFFPGAAGRAMLHLMIGMLVLACFYAVPVSSDVELPARGGLSIVLLGALGAVVMRQIRRYPEWIGRLLDLFLAVVAILALACYALAVRDPGQFAGLETRTDALYFTITTASTVGYGDIHAQGQAARALVTSMIVFDLVFLGALGSAISVQYQRYQGREAELEPAHGSTPIGREGQADVSRIGE